MAKRTNFNLSQASHIRPMTLFQPRGTNTASNLPDIPRTRCTMQTKAHVKHLMAPQDVLGRSFRSGIRVPSASRAIFIADLLLAASLWIRCWKLPGYSAVFETTCREEEMIQDVQRFFEALEVVQQDGWKFQRTHGLLLRVE